MVKQKLIKRTRNLGLSYLYYLSKPEPQLTAWYPNYKQFLALAKTDKYYLITDNPDHYHQLKSKDPRPHFPELIQIRRND